MNLLSRRRFASLCVSFGLAGRLLAQSDNEAAPQQSRDLQEIETSEAETGARSERFLRGPLAGRNQFPFALMVFALTPERARPIAAGTTILEWNLDYSNIIALQLSEQDGMREELSLDLEYLRTHFGIRRGLNESTELFVGVPFLVSYGGFLDPFIDGFHRAFGFPNLVRGDTPFGLTSLQYRIIDLEEKRAVSPVARTSPFVALGDVEANLKKNIYATKDESLRLAARGGLKFPTGSVDRASGSGAFDAALGFSAEKLARRFGFYLNLNYHFLGSSDELATKDYASMAIALDLRFKKNLSAVIQFEQLQPFIDQDLKLFNQPARQLALGLRYRASERFIYEWRFVEDLTTTSPDFSFGFQWRWVLEQRDQAMP